MAEGLLLAATKRCRLNLQAPAVVQMSKTVVYSGAANMKAILGLVVT